MKHKNSKDTAKRFLRIFEAQKLLILLPPLFFAQLGFGLMPSDDAREMFFRNH
jgi:hypothetical protein